MDDTEHVLSYSSDYYIHGVWTTHNMSCYICRSVARYTGMYISRARVCTYPVPETQAAKIHSGCLGCCSTGRREHCVAKQATVFVLLAAFTSAPGVKGIMLLGVPH